MSESRAAATAQVLCWARQDSGLGWEALARLFGVPTVTVRRWSFAEGSLTPAHEAAIRRFAGVVHLAVGITPTERRESLLRVDETGSCRLDRLARELRAERAVINPPMTSGADLVRLDERIQEML